MTRLFQLTLVCLYIVSVVGCATMQSEWEQTLASNTKEGYAEFIKKYPESQYSPTARAKIEEFDWENAKNTGTLVAYAKFMSQYTNSSHKKEALHCCKPLLGSQWRLAVTTTSGITENSIKEGICSALRHYGIQNVSTANTPILMFELEQPASCQITLNNRGADEGSLSYPLKLSIVIMEDVSPFLMGREVISIHGRYPSPLSVNIFHPNSSPVSELELDQQSAKEEVEQAVKKFLSPIFSE